MHSGASVKRSMRPFRSSKKAAKSALGTTAQEVDIRTTPLSHQAGPHLDTSVVVPLRGVVCTCAVSKPTCMHVANFNRVGKARHRLPMLGLRSYFASVL